MRTCGDCAHWYRPYEPQNKWDEIRYWWFLLWVRRYKDGTPVTNWMTFTCPSDKYRTPNSHGYSHWDIFPACKKFFKPKVNKGG